MANIFFTSDTHFSHTNIWQKFKIPCYACGSQGQIITGDIFHSCVLEVCQACWGAGEVPMRHFSSNEEMDEHMVKRWNDTVRPQDHVWHLGDVAMNRKDLSIVKRLNGHKRLIPGNHDIYDYKSYTEVGFKKIAGYKVLNNYIFSHIPIHPLSLGRFTANVHGHVHLNGSPPPHYNGKAGRIQPYINICVEATKYAPVDLEWIRLQVETYHT